MQILQQMLTKGALTDCFGITKDPHPVTETRTRMCF
jgi:hypothetical protein